MILGLISVLLLIVISGATVVNASEQCDRGSDGVCQQESPSQ